MTGGICRGIVVPHAPRLGLPEIVPDFAKDLVQGIVDMGEDIRKDKPDVIMVTSPHYVSTFNWHASTVERHEGYCVAQEAPDLLPGEHYSYRLRSMYRLMRLIRKYKRGLWIFAAAVCLMQMVPLHMHMHHSEDPDTAGISHEVDMSIADTVADQQHHDDAHVIDLSLETIVKSLDGDPHIPLLFVCLLTVFLFPSAQRWSWRADSAASPPRPLFLIFSPLRAPPRN